MSLSIDDRWDLIDKIYKKQLNMVHTNIHLRMPLRK